MIVKISVVGGVAYVDYVPLGVSVQVTDYDDEAAVSIYGHDPCDTVPAERGQE